MAFKEPNFIHVLLMRFAGNVLARSVYKKRIENLNLRGNERVLDFGSGPGVAAKFIAQELQMENGKLTCIDMSKVWMKKIKKKLSKFSNIEFKLGDISEFQIDAGSYDVIFINFVLHDVEKDIRQRTVNALSRALKKTGILYIKEPTSKSHVMPAEDIRTLMTQGGLEEKHFTMDRSFAGPPGLKYSGEYNKL